MKYFLLSALLCILAMSFGYYYGEKAGYRKAYESMENVSETKRASTDVVHDKKPVNKEVREVSKKTSTVYDNATRRSKFPKASSSEITISAKDRSSNKTIKAKKSVSANDITMVGYEQKFRGLYAYISLKNNTLENVSRVKFRIIYYDMQDNQLDYVDFDKSTNIAPGLVRKIEIDKFGEPLQYYYYKSEGAPDYFPNEVAKYKVTYQLLNYK